MEASTEAPATVRRVELSFDALLTAQVAVRAELSRQRANLATWEGKRAGYRIPQMVDHYTVEVDRLTEAMAALEGAETVWAEPEAEATDPAPTTFDFEDGNGPVPAHRHVNPDGTEGGWVADSAAVDPTCWVAATAQVFGEARVFGEAQVSGEALVFGSALVSGTARVFGEARVTEGEVNK